MTINFDNAATTFPKPPEVRLAVEKALVRYGSAGRGSHPIAERGSEVIYAACEETALLFGAEPERVVFTSNCTHALNITIQGILHDGGHAVFSQLEHNSVLRPVYALAKAGRASYSIAKVSPDDAETVRSFRRLIRKDAKATPHKARLTALHEICLHLFRHIAQKLLAQYACVIQSDGKFDGASFAQALCGVAKGCHLHPVQQCDRTDPAVEGDRTALSGTGHLLCSRRRTGMRRT